MFTKPEREVLLEMLEIHEGNVREAKEHSTVDRTIERLNDLTAVMASYDEQLNLIQSIREKIEHEHSTTGE